VGFDIEDSALLESSSHSTEISLTDFLKLHFTSTGQSGQILFLSYYLCPKVVTVCVLEKYVQGFVGHNNHYLQLGLSMPLA